jgi:hypothetical protein
MCKSAATALDLKERDILAAVVELWSMWKAGATYIIATASPIGRACEDLDERSGLPDPWGSSRLACGIEPAFPH